MSSLRENDAFCASILCRGRVHDRGDAYHHEAIALEDREGGLAAILGPAARRDEEVNEETFFESQIFQPLAESPSKYCKHFQAH